MENQQLPPTDMTELGYKIFLDRYALKGQPTDKIGTLVLAKIDNSKELARIVGNANNGTVKIAHDIDGSEHEVLLESLDFPLETSPEQMWYRTAIAVAKNEVDSEKWAKEFLELLSFWKFVPGGRILAAAGTNTEVSFYNCFVIPSPKDSKEGIFETANIMSQIMSRGGGVGMNISSLRPKYAHTKKTNGRSSGSVSWGELYSFVTGLIEQSGARRGALMLILEDWHPDIEEFATVKRDMSRITNANISIGLSDQFMEAVENDLEWELKFPDTTHPDYDELWDGDIVKWQDAQLPTMHYRTIRARDLWETVIKSAWASAEPGLWFKDRANSMSNSWYFNLLISTNPCVTGDTLVGVVDVTESLPTIKELADAGNSVLAWCYDSESRKFVQRLGRNPRKTRSNVDTWKVTLSDLSSITTTEDHKFMLWDGSVQQLKDLEVGTSLLPFGYIKASSNITIKSIDFAGKNDVYNITVDEFHTVAYITDGIAMTGIITPQCGEQPIGAWSVCNLGAINLSQYVADGNVLYKALAHDIAVAVRFLDNIIDITPYHFQENEDTQLGERRVGLGTLGLAEMLIKLKIRYGSEECLSFLNDLYRFIAVAAYDASISLAEEKGSFPKFEPANHIRSEFIKQLPDKLQHRLVETGIRNVTLLTQAPTGTTGTMVNTSTGIEPFYYWEWTRNGRLGSHKEIVKVYEEWKFEHEDLPDWFVTAQELTPEEHVAVQATIQKWVDSSISKTCNVPESYTVEQVGELYKLMYDLGCKGGTVYRDKSRNVQVLNLDKPSSKTRHRPAKLPGATYRKDTPVGTLYVTVNERDDGPFEVFLAIGKAGSELTAQAEALGRLISYILRLPSSDSPQQRLQTVVGQLRDIGTGRALGFGPNRVASLADGIAQCLADYAHLDDQPVAGLPEGDTDNGNPIGDLCPTCGNASFYKIEGCKKCFECGYSEC